MPLRIVVPITEWKPAYAAFPWFVEIPSDARNGLNKLLVADAFQTKSLSLARFTRRLGIVTDQHMEAVSSAIALCVGAL